MPLYVLRKRIHTEAFDELVEKLDIVGMHPGASAYYQHVTGGCTGVHPDIVGANLKFLNIL